MNNQYQAAFDSFMSDQTEVEDAIDMATSQSYGGTATVTLELWADGSYRVTPSVGNLYNSDGILVAIPALSSEDDEEDNRYYDNAIESLQQNFQEVSA